MNRFTVAVMMLVGAMIPRAAEAGQVYRGHMQSCLVEVLYSEELPIGPLFYHTYRATLLVTPADRPPFQTTVLRAMPWQVPPPRRGQRLKLPCDSTWIEPSFHLF